LESANYPFQNIDIIEREGDVIELVATLLGTTADPRELDGIISRVEQDPLVQSASWNLRTAD
jgi:putative Mg2+ transporter-C (MgtC) family protein